MQKQLKDLSLIELKSYVYDLDAEIKQKTQAIQIINQEISNRANMPETTSEVTGTDSKVAEVANETITSTEDKKGDE